jgi:heme oxygenase
MLSRLAAETRVQQSLADVDGLELVASGRGEARYLAYLVKRYGFEAPLESALAVAPGIDRVIDLHARRQTRRIVDELVALGMPLASVLEIPHADVSAVHDLRDALGWLYVSDRSAMTHGLVARELLRKTPALTIGWRHDWLAAREAMAIALEIVARSPDDEARILEAVLHGFEHQRRWIRGANPALARVAAV